MNKCRPTVRNSEPLINWTPTIATHKQTRQGRGGQDLRPSKRTKGPLKIKWSNKLSPGHSFDRRPPDRAPAAPSPGSSEASITPTATTNDPQDLPELVYSESMSPPDTDELHSVDDLCLSQNVLQKELHSELKWLGDLPGTNTDEHESALPGEDALFSQYLRSRSPSYFSVQGIGGNHDSDGGIYSQTGTPGDICLCAEEDPYPADLIDQKTAKPENIPVKTNRPRIILRIRLSKPGPKPKVLLRLS
ncbi:hypothetical protein OEA41_004405 [Lepraria neglecta]|uniref:Uncharacterized protein n=1 Tax=Lepraria neglecta TaxID=209136 RepID=A0AAD9YXT2_9LECA|nr:hypothetical protein OEA41_004405 [Lepraria neglecta]